MLAALVHSTAECKGPKVARRNFTTARITGATEDDIIAILSGGDSTVIQGSGDLPIPPNDTKYVEVEHQKSSGNPVNVELM